MSCRNKLSSLINIKAVLVLLILISVLPVRSYGDSPDVDPKADQVLRKMSDYLAQLQQFKIQTENALEIVLISGQKIQYNNQVEIAIKRPDKLRADRKGEVYDQEFYYDGKTLTQYSEGANVYATIEAPPTLDGALDFAMATLHIEAPGADLVYSNSYNILMEDVISGIYVGMTIVDGVNCHHLAYRKNDVDWQIWIEDGDKPLPKKFVITTKWLTGAPQYTITVKSWDLSPKLKDDMFTFVPPKDAQKIEFVRYTN
ncbi:MAG: DUF2092 domain-containing protein [Thermodesulfobacteriota bacterium]